MNKEQDALFNQIILAAKTLGVSEHRKLVEGDALNAALSNNREHLERLVQKFYLSFPAEK